MAKYYNLINTFNNPMKSAFKIKLNIMNFTVNTTKPNDQLYRPGALYVKHVVCSVITSVNVLLGLTTICKNTLL